MPFPALNTAFLFSLITTFVGLRHTDQDMPKPWAQFRRVPHMQMFLQICSQHHCCTFQDQNLELLQIIWITCNGFWPENLTWLRNCPKATGKTTHPYAHLTCSGDIFHHILNIFPACNCLPEEFWLFLKRSPVTLLEWPVHSLFSHQVWKYCHGKKLDCP